MCTPNTQFEDMLGMLREINESMLRIEQDKKTEIAQQDQMLERLARIESHNRRLLSEIRSVQV